MDLDSDEFEQALAGSEIAAVPSRKRQKGSSSSGALQEQEQLQAEEAAAAAPSEAAAAAAAADVNDTDQEGITEGEEQELEELVECSNDDDDALQDWQADAAAGSDSDVGSTSDGSGSEYSDNDGDAEAAAAAPKQKPQKQQPQKGKKQQKEKKPRKKRPSTRRLCVTFAKAQYRLTEADLQQLTDVVYEPNPHYPGGHRMRLYLVRELEELARAKEERQALLANTKEQRAAERAAATKARKAAAAAAAAEAAQRFTLQPQKEGRHGSLQLPDTCLTNVMACLASTLEPGGLRGPSCVAKELAQASLCAGTSTTQQSTASQRSRKPHPACSSCRRQTTSQTTCCRTCWRTCHSTGSTASCHSCRSCRKTICRRSCSTSCGLHGGRTLAAA